MHFGEKGCSKQAHELVDDCQYFQERINNILQFISGAENVLSGIDLNVQ